jgi:protein SCO1/2
MRSRAPGAIGIFLVALIASAAPVPARAQSHLPQRLEEIDVVERLGAAIPLGTYFADEASRPITLAELIRGDVPVIITFNYSSCPQLCSVQLEALVEALRKLAWTAGAEFRIVTISLDPAETPARARATRDRYLEAYGRPAAAAGWRFLVGPEASVRAVTDAVGFGYRRDAEREQYLHPAAIVVASPDGRVMRYLSGVVHRPDVLRLSLAEASEGKVGSFGDKVRLICFEYDPATGQYTVATFRVLRIGAGLTLGLLALLIAGLWRREAAARRSARPPPR